MQCVGVENHPGRRLQRGGKGYYALDITDPANPRQLWEFTNADMGYSYGNPAITKLADGTWVVIVASGYNNADGVGRLFVLNANTGAVIRTISTGAGSAATPSGLARISAHVPDSLANNTTLAVYSGDLLGNLWRFDINNTIGASGYDAQLLAKLTDAGGKAQPVTAKPLETTISGHPVVYVGTGRYLGTTDITDVSGESFYAVIDRYDQSTYYPRQTASKFVQQVLSSTSCPNGTDVSWCSPGQAVRTSTDNAIDWGTNNGWFIDFLTGGERSVSDATLGLGTLLFTTITPQQKTAYACTAAPSSDGSGSFLYALDYLNGGPVDGANGVSGVNLGNYYVTKPVMLQLPNGTIVSLTRISNGATNGSDGGSTTLSHPPIAPTSGSTLRRVSWRVLNGM
jgi:type IV pilus assembly protein PilY1